MQAPDWAQEKIFPWFRRRFKIQGASPIYMCHDVGEIAKYRLQGCNVERNFI